jgi:hypothetical protein
MLGVRGDAPAMVFRRTAIAVGARSLMVWGDAEHDGEQIGRREVASTLPPACASARR